MGDKSSRVDYIMDSAEAGTLWTENFYISPSSGEAAAVDRFYTSGGLEGAASTGPPAGCSELVLADGRSP
jgi:hypothetical protein